MNDLSRTFEHLGRKNVYHGPQCMWCCMNGRKPKTATKRESYPAGPELLSSGSGAKKRALLIGIDYSSSRYARLKGCVNDAKNMRRLMRRGFGFRQTRLLVDSDPENQPTRDAILDGFAWLVANAKPGDVLFLHYSGHGSQQRDRSGDEADGRDEVLVPVDFKTRGYITDDEVVQKLVRRIPLGVKLYALIDSCHSATMLDLPEEFGVSFRKRIERYVKGTVVCFGACLDKQLAQERNGHGVMTAAFVRNLKANALRVTCRDLLRSIHDSVREGQFSQTPVLSTSSDVDPDTCYFGL